MRQVSDMYSFQEDMVPTGTPLVLNKAGCTGHRVSTWVKASFVAPGKPMDDYFEVRQAKTFTERHLM